MALTLFQQRIFPWQPPDPRPELLAAGREMLFRLDPTVPGSVQVAASESSSEHDFTQRLQRFGSREKGFELLDREEFYEGGGFEGSRREIRVSSYGLADGAYFELSFANRGVSLEAAAGPAKVEGLTAYFRSHFGQVPSDLLLDSILIEAQIFLRRELWDAALDYSWAVLEKRANDGRALLLIGIASAAKGDDEMGFYALETLLEKEPTHVDALYNLGLLHLERQNAAAAVALFRKALEKDPANQPCAYQLGRALEQSGQNEEAYEAYRLALASSPNPSGAWLYRGLDFTAKAKKAALRLSS